MSPRKPNSTAPTLPGVIVSALLPAKDPTITATLVALLGWVLAVASAGGADRGGPLWPTNFSWEMTAPLLAPVERADPCYSVKDPSIVRFDGQWHVFSTIRSKIRSHQIEYLSFTDWSHAATATRHILTITNGYFCAPQVFWFRPHQKWYLLYQTSDTNRTVALQPAISTSANLKDPSSWTPPQFLYDKHPANVKAWIDFWIICDDTRAHLFFTSNNGLMWRAEAKLANFPRGWNEPVVVLRDDIFEASHTYRAQGREDYLTIIEAVGSGGVRYYKAYIADRLDGTWRPLAATRERPFAGLGNFRGATGVPPWTDSISHGELIRANHDERMEIDPAHLEFLFQGVSDAERAGKKYGEIPWRLGLLRPAQ